MLTIEPGIRIVERRHPSEPTSDKSGVYEDTLPGGLVATTIHAGSYDGLHQAYAAIESWMNANGFKGAGDPWEAYITDPGDYPNPEDWRTEVFWPVRDAR
jgi:AraC family transcriptional regulator